MKKVWVKLIDQVLSDVCMYNNAGTIKKQESDIVLIYPDFYSAETMGKINNYYLYESCLYFIDQALDNEIINHEHKIFAELIKLHKEKDVHFNPESNNWEKACCSTSE
jgi:hypothetical protein